MTLLLFLAFFQASQESCTISGTVINALTGEPLNKVSLRAEEGGGPSVPTTVTDAKGRFTLVNVPASRYRLKAQRNGFLDSYYGARRADGKGTPIALESGQQMKDLVLKLTPFGVLAGTVRDPEGEPLARLTVTVYRQMFESGRRRLSGQGEAITDDLGQFRIPDLAPGKYYVHAAALKAGASPGEDGVDHSPKGVEPPRALLPATYPVVQELGPGARLTGVDIVLARAATVPVKGHASAPAGLRISGLELKPADSDEGAPGLRLQTGVNDKGEFEFHSVPTGNYILTASATPPDKPFNGTISIDMFPQTLKARLPLQVGTTPVQDVRVVVEPGAQISGHLTIDGEGKSDESLSLIQFSDGQSDPVPAFVTQGNLFNTFLSAGHYTVSAAFDDNFVVRSVQAQGREIADEGLTISQPGKVAIEIVLAHDGGKLAGIALDADEKPVPGATVVLVPETARRARADLFKQSETDQYGRFTLEGIAPGEYKLFAWDDVEPGIWWDPDFLKKYDSTGQPVTIAPKSQSTTKVHLAPAQ